MPRTRSGGALPRVPRLPVGHKGGSRLLVAVPCPTAVDTALTAYRGAGCRSAPRDRAPPQSANESHTVTDVDAVDTVNISNMHVGACNVYSCNTVDNVDAADAVDRVDCLDRSNMPNGVGAVDGPGCVTGANADKCFRR